MSAFIGLLLINTSKSGRSDKRILFRRGASDDALIMTTVATDEGRTFTTRTRMSVDDAIEWLKLTLDLLVLDAAPYTHLQIMPQTVAPTVMIRVSELEDHRKTIVRAMRFYLTHWPTTLQTT